MYICPTKSPLNFESYVLSKSGSGGLRISTSDLDQIFLGGVMHSQSALL